MLDSIVNDIKGQFRSGNMVTRLIIINVGLFAMLYLVKIIMILFSGGQHQAAFQNLIRFLAVHSSITFDLTHPWVLITHMFMHIGFWHLLFNMLLLYWFGRIVGDLIGDDKPLTIYLLGGLSGMVFYILGSNFMTGMGSMAFGASAAVMAFAVAAASIAPDYSMRLILIGDVRLKYIVLVLLVLDLIGIANMSNTGGHIGHLGGAFFGWLYVYLLREGNDLSIPVNNAMNRVTDLFTGREAHKGRSRRSLRVEHISKNMGQERQKKTNVSKEALSREEQIDRILDKIRKKGLDSLSQDERDILKDASEE
jgi:membrane associated rhomboid family serine protease